MGPISISLGLAVAALTVDSAFAAGLPQLDSSKFAPQIVWLAITFAVLYVLMAKVALPRVGEVLEERQNRIDDTLEKAQALKGEAEAILEAYDRALAEARRQANDLLRQTNERQAAAAAERQADLSRRLAKEIKEAEEHIASARNRAVADIRALALELAQAAAAKLMGEVPDQRATTAAVDATLRERER